jgi:Xaa-Pro dipeptidase
LLDEAQFVKSREELAFLERSIELVEGAIETLVQEARPGVPEARVYAQMMASMLARGVEMPALLLWAAGSPQPPSNTFVATGRPLQLGDIVTGEIEASFGGYSGQVTITGVMGDVPPEYAEMFRLQQEILDRAYERCRPGMMIAELLTSGQEVTQGTPYQSRMIVQSRRSGNDAPVAVFGGQDERIHTWRIEERCVFVIKPQVLIPEWTISASWSPCSRSGGNETATGHGARMVCWGDTVVATSSGAQRLGKCPREFLQPGPALTT